MNENFNTKYNVSEKDVLAQLNLQKYHPSLIDESFKSKFSLNKELSPPDNAALLAGINPNIFSLNPLSSQYMKGLDLMTLHENLTRAQSTLDETQSLRIKQMLTLQQQNGDSPHSKSYKEAQNASKNNHNSLNDRNNNKSSGASSTKEKIEITQQQQQFENQQDKSNASSTHVAAAKAGVSLKCAYCESRDDFKTR